MDSRHYKFCFGVYNPTKASSYKPVQKQTAYKISAIPYVFYKIGLSCLVPCRPIFIDLQMTLLYPLFNILHLQILQEDIILLTITFINNITVNSDYKKGNRLVLTTNTGIDYNLLPAL